MLCSEISSYTHQPGNLSSPQKNPPKTVKKVLVALMAETELCIYFLLNSYSLSNIFEVQTKKKIFKVKSKILTYYNQPQQPQKAQLKFQKIFGDNPVSLAIGASNTQLPFFNGTFLGQPKVQDGCVYLRVECLSLSLSPYWIGRQWSSSHEMGWDREPIRSASTITTKAVCSAKGIRLVSLTSFGPQGALSLS